MADIYGSHFEYAAKSSREHGLVIANVEAGRMDKLAGDIEGVTIFNKSAKKRYLLDDDATNSPLTFDVEILAVDQRPIDFHERRKIEKWLFNKHDYRKLYLDMADDPFCETYEIIDGVRKRNYLNCRFINPEKLVFNDGVVGYKATLEADSSMFWQDAITKTFTIQNDDPTMSTSIVVKVDTDLDDYIYPKVSFTLGSYGGDVIITNHSDDSTRLTKFVGLSPFATVTMRGEFNYISGQYYEKFYKSNFIRLLDGANNISVTGDVQTITIEFQNRRAF